MRTGIKALLIVTGSALLLAGGGIFIAGCQNTKLASDERVVDLADKDVHNFDFDLSTSEVEFKVTTDGTKKVVFYENKNFWHEDRVEEHTLYVVSKDTQKWYEKIIPDFSRKRVEVYLPAGELGTLKIKNSTGDIKVPKEYTFESVDMELSTGDVEYNASVKGSFNFTSSTGDVSLTDVSAKSMKINRSTGSARLKSINVEEVLYLEGSTGNAALEEVRSESLEIKSSTGKVKLNDVIVSETMKIHASTGDVEFADIDAGGGIDIETSTGDVEGSLLTGKTFEVYSSSGDTKYPSQTVGAPICKVKTSTGDIKITVKA